MAKRTPAPAQPAIQSDDEAGREAQEYRELKAQVDQLEADEKAEIAEVRQKYKDRRKPLEEQRDSKFMRVQAWSEATRSGRKTIRFPNGRKAEWRMPSSPRLIVIGELVAIAKMLLRLENYDKYVKIELKKNNIKADFAELAKKLRGLRKLLSLDDTEYFRIT
ncbi:MAG TPA: host-nuclease inhibitor Gam family protein [Candidatus Saccharimonadales bacterium]|nr:host-nuclease inhibitor Gam family protein [Candidatus Saccharimonadales bacterium]